MTMAAVCELRPDRIALYGYAHVPWIKPGQRRFTEIDLPEGRAKRALYERGRERLEAAGYREIGLDHFALPTDGLWQAAHAGTMHRNFMGYTEAFTRPLLGLGVSAIGDAVDAFVQNEKDLQQYHERIARRELPIHRGHILDAEDQVLRRHILNLMNRMETRWTGADATPFLDDVSERLAEFAADGLVELDAQGCRVTEAGHLHGVRCAAGAPQPGTAAVQPNGLTIARIRIGTTSSSAPSLNRRSATPDGSVASRRRRCTNIRQAR
jgi:oxygen-independent coproporphyrinogen-3 oxidase